VVFVSGVIHLGTAQDVADNLVAVKMREMRVVPGGDGCISLLSADSVNVRALIKLDVVVAGVGVQNG